VKTEAQVLQEIRLEASRVGWRLWRNNVGVAFDANGRPVRYGLANDSAQLNQQIKSSDLIGIAPRVITPADVGRTLGQFVAIEVKRQGWRPSAAGGREVAQQRYIDTVVSLGGWGTIAQGVGDIWQR